MKLIKHYSNEIEKLFQDLETNKLDQILSQILQKESNSINENDDFFSIGGDSLSAVQLVSLINQNSSVKLSLHDIYNKSKISDLKSFLSQQNDKSNSNDIIDWEKESDPMITETIATEVSNSKDILVTGVTGFLGLHLLYEILQVYKNCNIYCHVRGANEEEAKNRLFDALVKAKLADEIITDFKERVFIVSYLSIKYFVKY